jgi:hypothetical protein
MALAKLRTFATHPNRKEQSAMLYLDHAEEFLPPSGDAMTTPLLIEALDSWDAYLTAVLLEAGSSALLDPRAEDLAETWFAGRISAPEGRSRVIQALDLVNPPVDENALDAQIASLTVGQFVLRSPRLDELVTFEVKKPVAS